MRTHYIVLGVAETADQTEIRSAYLRLLHVHHPDHNDDPRAGVITAEIIKAYAILGDPEQRVRYDHSHGINQPASPAASTSSYPSPSRPASSPVRSSRRRRTSASPQPAVAPAGAFPWFRTHPAITTLLVILTLGLGLYLFFARPAVDTSPRAAVNQLVEQLATVVASKATAAGVLHDGADTVNEYELDRSKFDPADFAPIADRLQSFLSDPQANAGGFVSRAYFNARLMQLSVATLNHFEKGVDISADVQQVDALGQDPYVRRWLVTSPYLGAFHALRGKLLLMKHAQASGLARTAARTNLDALNQQIATQRAQMQAQVNAGGSVPASVATSFNTTVETYNQLSAANAKNQSLYDDADLAFNRCLDVRFLSSRTRD
jgi:hypothetical protein